MNELPEVDFDGRNIKGRTTLPARLQVLDIGVQTIFIARNSTTLIDYEPAFLGEVFVRLSHCILLLMPTNLFWIC